MTKKGITYAPERCNYCRGTGMVVSNPTVGGGNIGPKCPICKGQGGVLVAQPPLLCSWCKGTGYWVGKCESCGGSGWALTQY